MLSAKVFRSLDVQPTGQVVSAVPCRFVGGVLINQAASARFLKIYDKATAALSTDTPIMTIPLAATAIGAPFTIEPIRCVNGMSIRGTTGVADADTGAPTANDIVVNLFFD